MNLRKLKDTVDNAWNSEEHKARRDNWRRFLKEYAGSWWNDGNISEEESRVFCNFIFSTIQTTAPLLTDNRPVWSVTARRHYFQRMADIYNDGLKYVWEVVRMDEKVLEAVYDTLIHGTAIFKVYFDPDQENGLGEVEVEVVDPFNFVISPGYKDIWKSAWCGMRKLVPMSDVRRMYPDAAKLLDQNNDEAGKTSDLEASGDDKKDRLEQFEIQGSHALVYEIWIRDEHSEAVIDKEQGSGGGDDKDSEGSVELKKQAYPNGRIVTFAGSTNPILLSDRPSPFAHGRPPYVSLTNYLMPHEFWGIGEPVQIENLNREFNVRLQQIVEHARRYTKINLITDDNSGIEDEVLKKAIKQGNQILRAKGGFAKDVVIPMTYPQLPPVVTQLLSSLPQLIEEVSGVTDVSKGVIGKKQRQSATEMSMLLESSYTRVRQRVRNLEYTIKRLATLIIELMQQYYTEPRSFYVKEDDTLRHGLISNQSAFAEEVMKPEVNPDLPEEDWTEEDKQEYADYQALIDAITNDKGEKEERVHFDFNVEIQTNSTLPLDKQALANLMLRLSEMQIVDAQAVLETLRIPGTQKILERLEKAKKEQAAQAGGGNGGGAQGGPPMPGGMKPEEMLQQIEQITGGGAQE